MRSEQKNKPDIRVYNVSAKKARFIEAIFKRRGIEHAFNCACTQVAVKGVSGNQFHRIVIRATMEMMQKQDGSSIPYLHDSEVTDFEVLEEVGEVYILKTELPNE